MTETKGLSLQTPLRPLSVLVFRLLLTHSCRGQPQLTGPPHSIVAAVGDDVILPCHLKPAMDVTAELLEWKRSDQNPRFVHVWRYGQDLEHVKNPSYSGRTSLFTDELKRGNISLKLSKVRLSDQGIYHCDLPLLDKQSSVKLVVASGAVPSPVISLRGIDRERRGVMLDCESAGWYPEPEVSWLDGEGHVLSAGPTETVRGPDDLYTVSSRVTVDKRHSNSFTCRVQQNHINQTRETHIQVPDDFFDVRSSSSSIIIGLAVGLTVCILIILLLFFFVWKQRQKKNKTKRSRTDETDTGEIKNRSEEEKKPLKKNKPWSMVSVKKLEEEQQRREDAENKVQILQEQLQTKTKELQDERTRREEAERKVQRTAEELQEKTAELQKSESNVTETKRHLDTETTERSYLQTEVQDEKKRTEQKTKMEKNGEESSQQKNHCLIS
ncbi:butyrophilin subfamily 3 member A3-like [Plectropomus leopardus]|uniref:butyrophilin subfamily 3 member A3-like n=1 Tax=Plectropomus leopardus TaxID=160734 RepID=UPI001C4B78D3|nr:butyrophilin subfamily 3 member A3-like [Plectropomus leopardus]